MRKTLVAFLLILGFILFSCDETKPKTDSQNIELIHREDQSARELLERVFADTTHQNRHIKIHLTKLSNEKSVIKAVEPTLFQVYGKEKIIEQKPYKVSKVDNYWIIEGVQKEPQIGGVFHLVLNSKNGTIIYLRHGR